MRFNIAYGRIAPLLTATGMPKSRAYLDIDDDVLDVRMSWGFNGTIPLTSITGVEMLDNTVWSIGVHGWNGAWLVNGKGDELVRITIDPRQKAKVGFVPVNLRELTVSVEERSDFVASLQAAIIRAEDSQ